MRAPLLYIALLLGIGAVAGGGLLYTALSWTGTFDDPQLTRIDSVAAPFDPADLEATQPAHETVYDTAEVMDTVTVPIPDFLTTREPSSNESDTTAGGQARPPDPDAVRARVRSVDAYWLPLVDGDPAITVTPGLTRAQVYDMTGRAHVLRYPHPEHGLTLAPVGGWFTSGDAFGLRLGVEADVALDPVDVRLSGGMEPTIRDPKRTYLEVSVRPFEVGLF